MTSLEIVLIAGLIAVAVVVILFGIASRRIQRDRYAACVHESGGEAPGSENKTVARAAGDYIVRTPRSGFIFMASDKGKMRAVASNDPTRIITTNIYSTELFEGYSYRLLLNDGIPDKLSSNCDFTMMKPTSEWKNRVNIFIDPAPGIEFSTINYHDKDGTKETPWTTEATPSNTYGFQVPWGFIDPSNNYGEGSPRFFVYWRTTPEAPPLVIPRISLTNIVDLRMNDTNGNVRVDDWLHGQFDITPGRNYKFIPSRGVKYRIEDTGPSSDSGSTEFRIFPDRVSYITYARYPDESGVQSYSTPPILNKMTSSPMCARSYKLSRSRERGKISSLGIDWKSSIPPLSDRLIMFMLNGQLKIMDSSFRDISCVLNIETSNANVYDLRIGDDMTYSVQALINDEWGGPSVVVSARRGVECAGKFYDTQGNCTNYEWSSEVRRFNIPSAETLYVQNTHLVVMWRWAGEGMPPPTL